MNRFSIRSVAQQAGLWCVLVLVVVLLTFLFTILGTITCAVLTGMMMATVKHRRWQTVPVSLVFPLVVLGLVQLSKVELLGLQRLLLPLLCFGVFWLMYLSTGALVRFEKRAESTPAVDVFSTDAGTEAANLAAARSKMGDLDKETPIPAGDLQLEALQGKWSCEIAGPNGETQRRILEVAGDHLSLSVIDLHGRTRLVAQGDVKLNGPGPSKPTAATPQKDAPDVPCGL